MRRVGRRRRRSNERKEGREVEARGGQERMYKWVAERRGERERKVWSWRMKYKDKKSKKEEEASVHL